jgi:hypothetical protein
MKKYLTSEITAPLKVIFLGLVLGFGVSVVSAQVPGWSVPPAGTVPPANNAAEPINILPTSQYKGVYGDTNASAQRLSIYGGFWANSVFSNLGLFANTLIVGNPFSATTNGTATILSTLDVHNKSNTGPLGKVRIGKPYADYSSNHNDYGAGMVIDLEGRGSGGAGRDGLAIFADKSQLYSNIITNKPLFGVWSTSVGQQGTVPGSNNWASLMMDSALINGNALIAGTVKIAGGTPGTGKVLTSSNAFGNAVWTDPNTLINQQTQNSSVTLKSVRVTGKGSGNLIAWCPMGYVAIGGGGDCESNGIGISEPVNGSGGPHGVGTVSYDADGAWSQNEEIGWMVKCRNNSSSQDVHANVICMNQGGGGTAQSIVWIQTSGSGSAGQSCNTWFDSQYPSAVQSGANYDGGATIGGEGCLYQHVSDPNKFFPANNASAHASMKPVASHTITANSEYCVGGAQNPCSASYNAVTGGAGLFPTYPVGTVFRTYYRN